MLFCDSRQQKGKHTTKNKWWIEHGVEIVTVKLEFGDYQTPGSNIAVDTKKDIAELAMDIGRDHDRFVRECEKARSAGYRLIVLVESNEGYNDREKLATWVSDVCRRCRRCDPRTVKGRRCGRGSKPMQGATVAKICSTLEERHGVRFEFTTKEKSAARICELLGIEHD